MKKTIRLIKARAEYQEKLNGVTEQRVAIYCRVSKGNKCQSSSIEWQRIGLLKYMEQNKSWKLVGIYTDEKSGINIKKRKDFKRLIQDCMAGKINIVLTKSMSRFSRNAVDFMTTARLLNNKGVKIMFDLEKMIYNEAQATAFEIRAAILEEESVAKSRNIRWGIKRRQQEGNYTFGSLLGYNKVDGRLVIDEKQAKTVRRIFNDFTNGKTYYQIAKSLEQDGILTGAGNSKWYPNKVKQILQNEKYVGDAHLGKHTTTDFMNNTVKKNDSLVKSYYVENGHPAIISREQFDVVQKLIREGYRLLEPEKYPWDGKVM